MRDKSLDNDELGKDSHNLPALAKESERIWREVGSFQIVMDDKSTGIKFIHIQKNHYAADGSKMVDGSHQYSRYKVIAIPWTGIDGLGLSCIMGVIHSTYRRILVLSLRVLRHLSIVTFLPLSHLSRAQLIHLLIIFKSIQLMLIQISSLKLMG
jgi:hypothetical protein